MVGVTSEAVIWHDVECASYDVDLPLWRELAEAAGGPVLDIGAGTGRVALDLARLGYDVTATDVDADLLEELGRRARSRGLRVPTATADARALALGYEYALAIAPMQVLQLFGGEGGRRAALGSIRRHLRPGGLFAAALADPFDGIPDDQVMPPMPDIREFGDWVYASRPISVRIERPHAAIDRLRQAVSPTGEVTEWVATIEVDLVTAAAVEAEAADCGFAARAQRSIPATTEWVGSSVVMLEAV
jgi:SAM-dependent methyltransferase